MADDGSSSPAVDLKGFHHLFNEPDAEVVLLTSDTVQLRVHAITLRRTSGFFASMLNVAGNHESLQSTTASPVPLSAPSEVVVPVLSLATGLSISPDIVRVILTYISLVPRADIEIKFDDLDKIEALISFCERYDFPGVLSVIRVSLQRPILLSSHPFRVFRISSRHHWTEVIQASAAECLKHDLTSPDAITGVGSLEMTHYGPLLSLARSRVEAFRSALDDPNNLSGSSPTHLCRTCQQPSQDLNWKVLRMRLVQELQSCPSGDTIRSEKATRWPEWVRCMSASHCGKEALYDRDFSRDTIVALLDNLPTPAQAFATV